MLSLFHARVIALDERQAAYYVRPEIRPAVLAIMAAGTTVKTVFINAIHALLLVVFVLFVANPSTSPDPPWKYLFSQETTCSV